MAGDTGDSATGDTGPPRPAAPSTEQGRPWPGPGLGAVGSSHKSVGMLTSLPAHSQAPAADGR